MNLNRSSTLRRAGRVAAVRQGYASEILPVRGAIHGARLALSKGCERWITAVRASSGGLLGFSRRPDGRWRTLQNVDLVLVATPVEDHVNVQAFKSSKLLELFDTALAQLIAARKSPANEVPIFLSVNGKHAKDLGHSVPVIGSEAVWNVSVDAQELAEPQSTFDAKFIERMKREFAEAVGVDVRRVSVEFKVIG